jgi:hypothetical protein
MKSIALSKKHENKEPGLVDRTAALKSRMSIQKIINNRIFMGETKYQKS